MATCNMPGENHSADTVVVWHGCLQPYLLCGYHASRQAAPEEHVHDFGAAVDEPTPMCV